MKKYRKKPVVIEASQFDGTDESVDWLLPQLINGEIGRSCNRLHIKTLEGVMTANIGDYIIKGVNGEFYPCKPDIFAKTYELEESTKPCGKIKTENLTFGYAVEALKHGYKVARNGWNGKNQYIELASNISYTSPAREVVNCNHDAIGNKAIAFVGTSGVQMGWLASQADMLAEDWVILE